MQESKDLLFAGRGLFQDFDIFGVHPGHRISIQLVAECPFIKKVLPPTIRLLIVPGDGIVEFLLSRCKSWGGPQIRYDYSPNLRQT